MGHRACCGPRLYHSASAALKRSAELSLNRQSIGLSGGLLVTESLTLSSFQKLFSSPGTITALDHRGNPRGVSSKKCSCAPKLSWSRLLLLPTGTWQLMEWTEKAIWESGFTKLFNFLLVSKEGFTRLSCQLAQMGQRDELSALDRNGVQMLLSSTQKYLLL